MKKGKLVVIDGADGSGKATQVALLVERLTAEGVSVQKLDFPRYTENFFGTFLRECLDGKYGDFMAVHPKIASALYAADRFESRDRIQDWLRQGDTVILDRYVSANMIHQGSKIVDEGELATFLEWLDRMEHEVFASARPDLIVHLDVPHDIRRALVAKDTSRSGVDLAESDGEHQRASEACARKIIASANDWHSILCTENGALRSREDIHEDVYRVVRKLLVADTLTA